VPGLEADSERLPCRPGRPAGRFNRRVSMRQRQAGMVGKGFARSGQLDATNATRQQFRPDLMLEVADLPAQRRL